MKTEKMILTRYGFGGGDDFKLLKVDPECGEGKMV